MANYVKSECLQRKGQQKNHLNELLDYLLDPQKSLDDFGRLDWCRFLIAGGTTFDEFAKTGSISPFSFVIKENFRYCYVKLCII